MPLVRLSRAALHYEVVGEGPALLCLMGFGATLEGFGLQARAFARGRTVVTFDNRGIGRSSSPRLPWRICDFTRDTLDLMDHLGIACADVLGISMGGMIGQELAIVAPSRVRTLILGASFAHADLALRKNVLKLTAKSVTGWARGGFGGRRRFEKALRAAWEGHVVADAPLSPESQAILDRGWELREEIDASDRGVIGQLSALLRFDARNQLHKIAAPTLVLAGSADALSPMRQARLLADSIPGAKLQILPGAPHGMNLASAPLFNAAAEAFLAQHSPLRKAG